MLDYLVHDPHFPRSIGFCLDAIETHLAELPHHDSIAREYFHLHERAPGALVPLTVPVSAEHPLTLDLRLGGT